VNNTQKRLETQLDDLTRKNEGLMKDKILLNGRIAALQAVVDTYKNERDVLREEIQAEDGQLSRLFKAVTPKITLKRQASQEGFSRQASVLD
jgi:hypothetical protein